MSDPTDDPKKPHTEVRPQDRKRDAEKARSVPPKPRSKRIPTDGPDSDADDLFNDLPV